ncbi:syntaxin-12 [Lasius niger]|uniref:Syntaxin-12 n=1 Tax=Lasius niger TaxID=67767 RepID=A0A0J7KJY0_LASNI|nr:syntaxin-12 [Lasius niger]
MAQRSQNYGSTDQRVDVPEIGFSPTELYSLSENITTNIYTINTSWKTLERAYKNIGTSKDNQGLRDKVHVTQLSTNQVVTQTSKDIARLTVLMRRGDKQQKLQIEKLTTDFKDALQRYSDMQKSIAEKMKRHILAITNIENSMDGEEAEETQRLLQKILPICLVGTKAMVSIGHILHNAMNIEAIVIVSANGECKIFWMRQ